MLSTRCSACRNHGDLSCVLLNIRGGVQKQAEPLAHLLCHDFICLTETWLAADDKPDIVPAYTYYSACRPLSDGPGRHSGGVGVFISSRVNKHIQFMKAADDASYLWLKWIDVVLGCPEVYLAVCYMPQKKDFMNHQKIAHYCYTVPI